MIYRLDEQAQFRHGYPRSLRVYTRHEKHLLSIILQKRPNFRENFSQLGYQLIVVGKYGNSGGHSIFWYSALVALHLTGETLHDLSTSKAMQTM